MLPHLKDSDGQQHAITDFPVLNRVAHVDHGANELAAEGRADASIRDEPVVEVKIRPADAGSQDLDDGVVGMLDHRIGLVPRANGKLHPIAITDSTRSPALPDVPTFAEAGVPGMEVFGWQGLVAPKGLPPAIKKKLHELAVAAMKDPEVVERLTDLGIKIVANSPEEFTAYQAREYTRWKALIEARKITAE